MNNVKVMRHKDVDVSLLARSKYVKGIVSKYLENYDFQLVISGGKFFKYDKQLKEYYWLDQNKPLLNLLDDYIDALKISIGTVGDYNTTLTCDLLEALESKIIILES